MFIARKTVSITKKAFIFSKNAFLRSDNYIPTEVKEEIGRKVISVSERIVLKTSSFLDSLKQNFFSKKAVPLNENLIENNIDKTVSIPFGNEISKDLSKISITDFLNHKFQTEFLPKMSEKINLKEKYFLDSFLQNKKEILPFIFSSPFIKFSSVFGSVLWVTSDLFYKEIIHLQELEKIKLKNKIQLKRFNQNKISNNIENTNTISSQNKKEVNLQKISSRSKQG